MPDAFDDLSAAFATRPPRRRLRLPAGWRDPDDELDALSDLDEFIRRPSALDEQRGTIFDPDLDDIEFQQQLEERTRAPEKTRSQRFVEGAVRHIFEPPEFVRRGAEELANWIEGDPTLADVDAAESGGLGVGPGGGFHRPMRAFAGGAVRGAAELLNPFDLATSATGIRAVRGARQLSNSLEALQMGGSAFLTGAGLERGRRAFVENRPEDYGHAALETGMGAAGILAGAHGMRGADPALQGDLLHPEGTYSPGGPGTTAIGPVRPRRRPYAGPDIDADFWSDEGPFGPAPPAGPAGGGRGLPDPFAPRDADILPDEVGSFPYREPPRELPPAPQGQLGAARRFYGRGDSMFDAGEGLEQVDELESFLGGADPRFYQGRRGVADVQDRPGRTRVVGPTADMGPGYGLLDDRNEAVEFPPEWAAEHGIYPEPVNPPPVGRLMGMPFVGEDEGGPGAWRGTGVDRPDLALRRRAREVDPQQLGLDELADFLGEGAPVARQQADIRSDMFEQPRPGPIQEPAAVTPEQNAPPATAIAPPKGGRRVVDPGLDPRVLREIGRMVSEAEKIRFEKGGLTPEDPLAYVGDPHINRPNIPGGAHYSADSPMATIVHALQQLTGLSAGGRDIGRRLRQMIESGRIRKGDKLWDAAVQLANARISGQRHFKDPNTGLQLSNPYTGEPINLRGELGIEEGNWAVPEHQRAQFDQPQDLGDVEVSYQEVEAVADRLDPDFVDRWAKGWVNDAEMRAAIDEANAADLGNFFEEEGRAAQLPDDFDALERIIGAPKGPEPNISLVDEPTDVNASLESAASAEALSRQGGMQERGEAFVVYDRAGNRRPLIGPEAVDYQVRPGEIYGVEGPEGFRVLDDAGGRLPRGEIVRDMKEALRGPRERDTLDTEDAALSELEELQAAIFGEEGPPLANTPADRRMGRRLSDMMPEGYLDDPATQEWMRRLEAGEVAERRAPLDDVLDTGEVQPRLGGAEGVRELDVATPQMDAPFSLGMETNERPFAQPSLEEMVDVEGERWPETRHEVENPAKVDEIAQSMQRVGWKGRPALVVVNPDGSSIAWTATHRLAAARQAGIPYADVPKVEIDAAQLAAKGFDVAVLSQEGKKARIKALVDAGMTDAANLLEAERKGSPERAAAAASGVPEEVPDNVADFLYKQLKYSRAEISAMGPAEAVRVGKERIVNPNAPAPRARVAPEVGLERLLESDPELAASYQRNIEQIPGRVLRRGVAGAAQRVRRSEVYRGGGDEEANLPASQLGLPERQAPPAGVEAEDLITEGLRERPRRERPESALTSQEREARGLAPIAKEKLSSAEKSAAQSAARGKQTEMVHRAREMARLINNPSPANLDEYVRLLGEQHKSQAKRELTGGTSTKGPERYRETGEYLASGLGGLEKLYRENPAAFWTLMRSSGGALIGALVDDEDPLRGAALGAIMAGGAPTAFNRIRQVLRTGKIKPPRASEKDISWYRLFMAPSPERTIPDVFKRAQESFRELERLYSDTTRSQSSNIAAKQLYLGDLATELRELSVEAKDAGLRRKSWYLNAMARAVSGEPTAGQRKVSEVGARLLEGFGFSSRKAATPLHQTITEAFSGGRTKLQEAADNLARAKREHSARVQARDPRTPTTERERSRVDVDAARDRLQQTMRDVGQSLRGAADAIDAEVGRKSEPGLVNQARRAREVGRKIKNYKSVKQAMAALERLQGELGQGELRVKPDVVERTVQKVVYRTLIGYALDTAIQNLSQPILTTLFVKPSSLLRGYRYARTPKGKSISHEIELRTLVDEETGAIDDRPLRVIADADGTLKAVKAAAKDSSRALRVTDNYNRRVSYLAALDQKGALEQALRTGVVPEAADEFAREVVRKTQGHVGPLGNNPFQRGPVMGSIKPFTKYPGLFLENVLDAMNDPKARGRAAVVALLGAMLAARGTGLDFEDMLISGGRPFGINLAQPGSLRPDRIARATPAGRAVSDVIGHVSDVAGGDRMTHEFFGHDLDSFLHGDLAYLLLGRYPSKVAQKGTEFAREGMEHSGLTATGEGDPHSGMEDLAELAGIRSTRLTEKRATDRRAQEAVNRIRRDREDTGAEARRLASIAIQRGDDAGLSDALAMMSPAQRRAFLRTLGRTRRERLELQLPRAERPGFREEFSDEDELADFVEGR